MSDATTGSDAPSMAAKVSLEPLSWLSPYADNAKEHPDEQVEKIADSIQQYGWDVPIVADENGEIIKGHGRYAAAQELGLDNVPVIIRTDLSNAEKRAARIADNRASESDWDGETLALELDDLQNADLDYDLSAATGFEDDELDDYFDQLAPPDPDPGALSADPVDDDTETAVVLMVGDEDEAEYVGNWAESEGYEWHVTER